MRYHLRFGVVPGRDVMEMGHDQQTGWMGTAKAVLVEWNANQMEAFLCIKSLARAHGVPLLALCLSPSVEADQVAALVVGADDVVTAPLSLIVIQAKLRAYYRHRRTGGKQPSIPATDQPLSPGAPDRPLLLNSATRRFYVNGVEVDLTPIEFELMKALLQADGACLHRDALLAAVWGIHHETGTNILDVHVYALRQKLGRHGVSGVIQTVRGVGYRIVDAGRATST